MSLNKPTPTPGKIYLIERNGEQMPALCKDTTRFQAKVEIDSEEDPIWLPLSAIGKEVTQSELQEEAPLLALLVNAQALIERAIVEIVNQGEEEG